MIPEPPIQHIFEIKFHKSWGYQATTLGRSSMGQRWRNRQAVSPTFCQKSIQGLINSYTRIPANDSAFIVPTAAAGLLRSTVQELPVAPNAFIAWISWATDTSDPLT